MSTLECFACGHRAPVLGVVGRNDSCQKCGADLHSCRNCQHYDRNAYNECREPVAERVIEKERANFCDQFTPAVGRSSSAATSAETLRAAAEALFKKR